MTWILYIYFFCAPDTHHNSTLPSDGNRHRTLRPQPVWCGHSVVSFFFCWKVESVRDFVVCFVHFLFPFYMSNDNWGSCLDCYLIEKLKPELLGIVGLTSLVCICGVPWGTRRSLFTVVKRLFLAHTVCVYACVYLSAGKDTHMLTKRKESSLTFLSPYTHAFGPSPFG